MTFSSTDWEPNRARFWNVRAMPSAAMRCVGISSTLWLLKWMLPACGWYRRLMQLNNELLPAPLGPITPQIWPWRTLKETSASTWIPPNLNEIPSILSCTCRGSGDLRPVALIGCFRSDEQRVGKECECTFIYRWSPEI